MRFEIGRDSENPKTAMRVWTKGAKAGLIRISPWALRQWKAGEAEAFWRSILHEVAHLQADEGHLKKQNHNAVWKRRAAALGACRIWGTVSVRFPESE